jgi:hypothetical protein
LPQVPHAAMSPELPLRPAAADHRVEFYTDDTALVRSVVDFLHPALPDGRAIAAADADHRDAVVAGLAETGTDVPAALASGRLVLLDATESLERFMADEVPEPAGFFDLMGDVLAGSHRGPVRVYGEMVAVLWEAGSVSAAMRLEELWNELGATHDFALLCGYPAALFAHPGASADFAVLCDHHSAVTVPGQDLARLPRGADDDPAQERAVGWHFPPEFISGARARQRLRAVLTLWRLLDVLDEAELLTTELVNNAVMHARSEVLVTVTQRRSVVRVEVTDVGDGAFRPEDAGLGATHGRGLMLVEAMSAAWGTAVTSSSKTVWFELLADSAA